MPCVESDMQKRGNCANLSLLILFFVLFFLVLIFKPIAEWQKLREGPSPKSALYWTVLGSAEQVVQVIQVGQVCIQKIYGFHGLNHQIIEKG